MSQYGSNAPECTGCVGDKFEFVAQVAPGCPVHDIPVEDLDIPLSKEATGFRYCPKGRCDLPAAHRGHCSDAGRG